MRLTDLTPEKEKVGCAMPQESLYDILGVAREATKEGQTSCRTRYADPVSEVHCAFCAVHGKYERKLRG